MPRLPYPHRLHMKSAAAARRRALLTIMTDTVDRYRVRAAAAALAVAGILFVLYPATRPPSVRIAHGLLLAAGCLWLAIGLCGRRQPVTADGGQRATVGAVITD